MASTVTKILPACGRCQMFVSICGPCSRRWICACLVDYNAQISIGNGQKVLHQYEIRHTAFAIRLLPFRLALKPARRHAPPCRQRTFNLWCAHAETFRHRCGARSSKPVAGLAVCGRFDPYTSPPVKSLFRLAVRVRRFFTPVLPGFFCFCARCARGQPVAAGPGAELFF